MDYTLIEPCCGSAALTLHMLGATRPLMPYQGTKWRQRRSLEELLGRMGVCGPPSSVVLADAGPWGRTMVAVLVPDLRGEVIEYLCALDMADPRVIYEWLQKRPTPRGLTSYAAQHLFLQRLAFSGKAVGGGGFWKSPGFNRTSAYGVDATERFGAVNPMIPSLIKTLRSYDALRDVRVSSVALAADVEIPQGRSVVYLDPPYEGTTAYPDGTMARDEVIALAMGWKREGCSVVVSERAPLAELAGWQSVRLHTGRTDTSNFRSKQEEWATFQQ